MGDHVRLLLAPAGQSLGPLAGPAQLVHALPERDRVAVHESGDDRRQLPRNDGHHHLVQQSQALFEAPLPDEGVTLLVYPDCDEILIHEMRPDLGYLRSGVVCGLVVTVDRVTDQDRNQQVPALAATPLLAFKQPWRSTA